MKSSKKEYNMKINRFLLAVGLLFAIFFKYVNDDKEYSYEDSCTIDMQPYIYKTVNLSDVFFDISIAKEIEAVRIIFENSKIQIQ